MLIHHAGVTATRQAVIQSPVVVYALTQYYYRWQDATQEARKCFGGSILDEPFLSGFERVVAARFLNSGCMCLHGEQDSTS